MFNMVLDKLAESFKGISHLGDNISDPEFPKGKWALFFLIVVISTAASTWALIELSPGTGRYPTPILLGIIGIDFYITFAFIFYTGYHIEQVEHKRKARLTEDALQGTPMLSLLDSDDLSRENVNRILLSTSSAISVQEEQAREAAIKELVGRIDMLAKQVENQSAPIVQSRIDPILEAKITVTLEHIVKKVENLENNLLSKWDVVGVIFALAAGLMTLLGLAGIVYNYWHK